MSSVSRCNSYSIPRSVQFLFGCLATTSFFSCATPLKQHYQIQPLQSDDAVTIEIKGVDEEVELQKYVYRSHEWTDVDGRSVKSERESSSFDVQTTTLLNDESSKLLHQVVETVKQSGDVNLHDLGFPQKKERISFIYSSQSEVLKAGGYDKRSLFFVPPVPLPKKAVKVGDSWDMTHSWVSQQSGFPLTIKVTALLKDLLQCGEQRCASVELSGHVEVPFLDPKKVRYSSRILGRYLFNLDRGKMLWSKIVSEDSLQAAEKTVNVQSCIVSTLHKPKKLSWLTVTPDCEPEDQDLPDLPKIELAAKN